MTSQEKTSPKTPAQIAYPDQYYAQYDPQAAQPAPVLGWYDMWGRSSLDGLPPLSELLPLSAEFWKDHLTTIQTPRAVQNGQIVPYTPPAAPVPLKTQAASALQQARSTIYNNYGILNEPTPADWVAYLKALMAIENGTDTASTTLPTAPASTTE